MVTRRGSARGQFQANTGASKRDDPDLRYTEVMRDSRRAGPEVVGGLARQQVELEPAERSNVCRDHSWRMYCLVTGSGVFGAAKAAPGQAILHTLDQERDPPLKFVSCSGSNHCPPGSDRDEMLPAASASALQR